MYRMLIFSLIFLVSSIVVRPTECQEFGTRTTKRVTPFDLHFAAPKEYVSEVKRMDVTSQLDVEINFLNKLFELEKSKLDILRSGRDSVVKEFVASWVDENIKLDMFCPADHDFCEVDMGKVDLKNIDPTNVLARIYGMLSTFQEGRVTDDLAWKKTIASVLSEDELAKFKRAKALRKDRVIDAITNLHVQIYGIQLQVDDEQETKLHTLFKKAAIANLETKTVDSLELHWVNELDGLFACSIDESELAKFLRDEQLVYWDVFNKTYYRDWLPNLEDTEDMFAGPIFFNTLNADYMTEVKRLVLTQQLDVEIEFIQSIAQLDDNDLKELHKGRKAVAIEVANEWRKNATKGMLFEDPERLEAMGYTIGSEDLKNIDLKKASVDMIRKTAMQNHFSLRSVPELQRNAQWMQVLELALEETEFKKFKEIRASREEKLLAAVTEAILQKYFVLKLLVNSEQEEKLRGLIKSTITRKQDDYLAADNELSTRMQRLALGLKRTELAKILTPEQLMRWYGLSGMYNTQNHVQWLETASGWKRILPKTESK